MTTYERVEAIFAKNDKIHDSLVEMAGIIDNLTARLGNQTDLTIETGKQLAMVRATRDAYLRELETLRDRLARTDVGQRPTDERIADALEGLLAAVNKFPVSRLP